MGEAEILQVPNDSKIFKLQCPDRCTDQLRIWICDICGDFALYCSCGSKKYDQRFLKCHHSSHQLNHRLAQIPDFNNKDLLLNICRLLQIIRNRYERNTHEYPHCY